MTVTINGTTFANLRSVPLKYDADNLSAGLSARRWEYIGLLTPAEFTSLTNIYQGWRNSKITEDDPAESLVQGTTVTVTVTGTGGATAVNCWFDSAPVGTALGKFIEVNFGVVDAAEKVEVLSKLKEEADEDTDAEDIATILGTYTYGGVAIKLVKPKDTFRQSYESQLTLSGKTYISGSFIAENLIIVDGFFDSDDEPTGVADINAQYEIDATGTLSPGDYVPIAPPDFGAEAILKQGVTVIRYSVTIQLLQVT